MTAKSAETEVPSVASAIAEIEKRNGVRKLAVEVNSKAVVDKAQFQLANGSLLMITPPIDEDFWLMRVPLSDKQAIVCFPKFGIIGCGFQKEEDWNTNLPLSCEAEQIFRHISHNKGDDSIADADCIAAIRLLQDAIEKAKQS